MDSLADHLRISIAIIAVVDPIGVIPIFLAATEGRSEEDRKRTAATAALTMMITLLVAAWFGDHLLYLLGISLPAFQVGGGLLLLLMSISMLHAHSTGLTHRPEEDEEARDKEEVGVVPLGVPLMAGPGSIALVILHNPPEAGTMHAIFLSLSIVVIGVAVWLILRAGTHLGRALGKTGINIFTRLMGLLLSAIAVELIVAGMVKLLPGLA